MELGADLPGPGGIFSNFGLGGPPEPFAVMPRANPPVSLIGAEMPLKACDIALSLERSSVFGLEEELPALVTRTQLEVLETGKIIIITRD